MATRKIYTARQAARKLGVSLKTFRKKAPTTNLRRLTGRRGRPAHLWTFTQLRGVK